MGHRGYDEAMPTPTRRSFIAGSASALAAAALLGRATPASAVDRPAPATAPHPSRARGNPLAVSTYSFWRFKPDQKLSIERCIEQSAAMGFEAVEILHRQM